MSQEEERVVPQEEQPAELQEGVLPPLISQPAEDTAPVQPSPPAGEPTVAEDTAPVQPSPPAEEPPVAKDIAPAQPSPSAEEPPVAKDIARAQPSPPAEEPPVAEDIAPAQPSPAAEEPPGAEDIAPAQPSPPAEEPPPEDLPDQQAEEEKLFQRPRSLKDLKPGMVLEGKVTSVAIYGAFVDIGVGREGLVHLSQLSDHPVTTPTEVVQIGDMVTVRVLDVDVRNKRVNLTMREQVEPEIDEEKLQALIPGTVLEGTVTSITRFGAFVDIGVGRDGLVPRSQLAPARGQEGEDLQVGAQVMVRVLDVDMKSGRIRLSMRNVFDPQQLSSLEEGAIVRGRVTSLAPYGAFVDVGVGKDGLLHVSAMGDGDVRHPREVVEVGQEIELRVVEVDPDSQRISLSMQLEEEAAELEWVSEIEEEAEPALEPTLENLAAHFGTLRAETREKAVRGPDRGEKEKRAVREALRRTLEGMRREDEES